MVVRRGFYCHAVNGPCCAQISDIIYSVNTAIKRLVDQKRAEVAELRRKIESLTRDIETAQLKLEAYEEAGAAADGSSDLFATKLTSNTGRRRRPLSDQWRDVLLKVAETGSTGAKMDDIVGYANGVERKLVRSQMRYYQKQKFVRRSGERFIVTEAGIGACKA